MEQVAETKGGGEGLAPGLGAVVVDAAMAADQINHLDHDGDGAYGWFGY